MLKIRPMAMVTEQFLLIKLLRRSSSYFFGSIGSVFAIITISIKKPNLFSKLLTIKGNWTMYAYIFHPAIIACLSFILSSLKIQGLIIDWLKPIIVLILTIFISIIFNLMIELIKSKLTKIKNGKNSIKLLKNS